MKTMNVRARVLTGTVAVAAVAAVTLGVVPANAAHQGMPAAGQSSEVKKAETIQSTHLSIDAATEAAQATLDAAEKEDQRITVAVVDRSGNTIVSLRGDGAGPQSYESAERKAYTAVSWNAPTSELVKRLSQTPNLKDIPGTLFLAGGAPVVSKGAPIAGIGVAGAPSGDLDEKFAKAGVERINR